MKKILFFLFLFFGSFSYAQQEYSLGLNFKIGMGTGEGGFLDSEDRLPVLDFGFSLLIPLWDQFSYDSGLQLIHLGEPSSRSGWREKYTYLQIPLQLRVQRKKFFFSIGPDINYLLAYRDFRNGTIIGREKNLNEIWVIGASANTGFVFPLAPKANMNLGLYLRIHNETFLAAYGLELRFNFQSKTKQ